ncbi:HEAT repeat domain containing protein [Acanthamoeba castellanii str. Neff]|uniref:HEAT repeat domain containing protein n=1 Tax=Acanthamoeba castellanii (strain ATCC 30010 / Neff) TaxID=1257118 RepID=L8GKB3_ACACF|nr:HEAT repeat domain containing protein [Acanthamoeba castellanii str. Neff]ELR13153.1 HEAT repeat domain containing protein [Acanthamoeba castellanii str. Neff]
MIERVVGELMDVHPDLRVKEAALRWLRHGSVPDSDLFRMVTPTGLPHLLAMACSTYTNYRPQRVLELAADSPTRIRVLPWIVGPELALEVVIETAFAAVMDNDIMVATEGCKVLGHYSVLNDEPASREIDAYAHRADLLVKTTVRRRPPVASLLALAAKVPYPLNCTRSCKTHRQRPKPKVPPCVHLGLDELQKAAKATLLRLGGVIPALYDHVVPYVVSMLCPDHQWQLREGGLLVLGCMMRKWTELHSGYADLHLSVISSLTDPEARIRRRAAWVADASLRWLDEATQKEAISLLVPLLHDPDHKVQGAAYKALRRPVVKTIIEGCLNHLQHSALPWGCQDELTLLTLAHWIPDFVRGDDDVHDTDVVAGCVVDGEQLIIACERHFEATSAVFLAGLGALCSLLEHGLVSLEPDRATKWILFAVDTLQLNSLPGLSALYCFIKRYPECVTAQLSLVVPALMTRPLAYNLQESMYGFCMCIDALTTHCTEGVRAWVTSLSSFLVRHNYSMPQHMALRCCVQLAQCGAADLDPGVFALLTELNGGTLHAITASVSGIEHTFRPTTEGLANLLLESLAARKAHLAAPAFDLCAREIPSPQAALGLFMLFADHLQRRTRAYQRLQTSISQQQHTGADARGLPQVEENRCCPYGQDDSKELRDKVQRVLHELAARIGERLLREQKRRLQRHAGGLRRYLHAESPLLALLEA